MITVTPLWETDPIAYLLLRRFPELRVFEGGKKGHLASMTLKEEQELKRAIEDHRAELERLSEGEIAERIVDARQAEEERLRLKAIADEDARAFNRPEAQADFEYWSKMSYWTIDEAVALSLGREPKFATWPYVQTILRLSPFAAEFAAKREVAMRAKAMGQLWDSTIPTIFLAWAERMKFGVAEPLIQAVRGLGFQVADWKTLHDKQVIENQTLQTAVTKAQEAHLASEESHSAYLAKVAEDQKFYMATAQSVIEKRDATISEQSEKIESLTIRLEEVAAKPPSTGNKSATARERDSLLKLVIGMAVKGYGHDPRAGRSTTAKEIAGDLALAGVPLDEDTVRKYLTEARELLSGDEAEQKS